MGGHGMCILRFSVDASSRLKSHAASVVANSDISL